MSHQLPREPRFIADAMLGRLARWLRLLGFDTLYYNDIKDGDLLKMAVREGRIILTRDSHFSGKRDSRQVFMVHSDHTVEQVREVFISFGIMEFGTARCPVCNGVLDSAAGRESVRDMVPEHVFVSGDGFRLCPACRKVYWEGTHLKRFRERIETILKRGGPGVLS